MVELRTEASGAHQRLKIFGGGGDDGDVDRDVPRASETPYGALLDDLEQLRLQRQRKVAELVEKQRAAVRGLEQPGLRLPCIGERPSLESEHLRFEKRLGDGGAVHVDERTAATRAGLVHRPREQPLPGARLALNQHRRHAVPLRRSIRQPCDLAAHGPEGGTLSDDAGDLRHTADRTSGARRGQRALNFDTATAQTTE